MEKSFKTRLNKDDTSPTTTKAQIDFTGVSQDELEELASATVVINQQAIYRTSGVIPATDTISVRAQLDAPRGGGFKVTPESMAARVTKFDKAAYQQFLEKADLGLTAKQIESMVSKKFPA